MTSSAFRAAAYPERSDDAFVVLLEIDHDDLATPIRLTDAAGTWYASWSAYTIVGLGNRWISTPMEVEPPSSAEGGGKGKIRIPNVDAVIAEAVFGLKSVAKASIWVVLESDPDEIVGGPFPDLEIRNVRGNALIVEADISRRRVSTSAWPRDWVRPNKFLCAGRMG